MTDTYAFGDVLREACRVASELIEPPEYSILATPEMTFIKEVLAKMANSMLISEWTPEEKITCLIEAEDWPETVARWVMEPATKSFDLPTQGPHMHRLWTDIVQTLRSQTGIHDHSYTQWLKELAASEILCLRAESIALRQTCSELRSDFSHIANIARQHDCLDMSYSEVENDG